MDTREHLTNGTASFRYVWGRGVVPDVLVEPSRPQTDHRLRINVVFTDLSTTETALRRAAELAIDLGAETRILVPHVVPYPLPLECPAVPLEFTCRRLTTLAESAGADPCVDIYLCRDAIELLVQVLPPTSIVVLHARTRFGFPTTATRIVRALRKVGCSVIVV
jgi:hypothetical protein